MNLSEFVCIGQDFLEFGHHYYSLVLISIILWFDLDFHDLVWISRVGPDFYEFYLDFDAFGMIYMNSPDILFIVYDFLEIFFFGFLWTGHGFYSFVLRSLVWSGFLGLTLICMSLHHKHALLMISKNSWFLCTRLDFYALIMISMNLPEFLCIDYDFSEIFRNFYGTVLKSFALSWNLRFGLDF